MENFNYQVVFKVSDDERIIFAGTTSDCVTDLVHYCEGIVNYIGVSTPAAVIENFVYQPVKINQLCHESEDPRATNE